MTRLLAAGREGLVVAQRGRDGAWAIVHGLAGEDVRCVAAGDGWLFAGTQGGGVHRSPDGGQTWRRAGLDGRIVKSLALGPQGSATVLAGLKPASLAVSHDLGERWVELEGFARMRRWFWRQPAERPSTAYVQAVAIAPDDPGVMLAGIEAATLLRSADGGATWTRHWRGVALDCHAICFHPTDATHAYVASGTGASVSRDGGRTWARALDGLDRRYGWSVAADPADASRWYVCSAPMRHAHTSDARARLYRRDGDRPWERLTGGLPASFPTLAALATDPTSPGDVYAAQRSGEIWRSADRGQTWAQLRLTCGPVRSLAVVPGEP